LAGIVPANHPIRLRAIIKASDVMVAIP